MARILHILTQAAWPDNELLANEDLLLTKEAVYLAMSMMPTMLASRKILVLENDWIARSGSVLNLNANVTLLNIAELPDLLTGYDNTITW